MIFWYLAHGRAAKAHTSYDVDESKFKPNTIVPISHVLSY